ncbi:MAG: NAD(P)H-dependent oxidoreductase [Candidatus Thorarchaeota archaeon]|jgi:multimeric flavodoxin WrbA
MKILAILGSPHRETGATYELLSKVLAACEKDGAETEIIMLSKKKILYCVGCANCLLVGECSIRDDIKEIHDKMFKADGLILASPVYLGTVTGQMKTFLDRSLPLGHRPRFQGKYGLAVVASGGIFDVQTRDYLQGAIGSFGASVVGGICGVAVGPGMFEDEAIVFEHAERLGHQLITAIKEKHRYPETGEDKRARAFFRDLIIRYQGLFEEDYQYWKKMGWLELPTDAAAKAEEEAKESGKEFDQEALDKVRQMFEDMPQAFNPDAANKTDLIYQMEIHQGGDTLLWHFIIKDQICTGAEGGVDHANLTIISSAKDWIDVAEGRLGGMKAFVTGRMKAKGKMRLLTKFEKLFPTE